MLVINNCQFNDEGNYSIEALGKKSTATLTVEGMRLKFELPLQDQTEKEGNTARFELEISHENVPVTWYKNEVKFHVSRTVLIHSRRKKHTLEIKELTLDDICQVKAEAKGILSMAKLTVIGNPCFVALLKLFVIQGFAPCYST
ncbi:unnamed protein product [Coregonus sp. 'balchen']|nr:unnamed protein product [Coregonus sp. 'balchen']